MTFLGVAIILICLLSILALVLYFNLSGHEHRPTTEHLWIMVSAIATAVLALLTFVTLLFTMDSTNKASRRSEALFRGQNTPLIDVTPTSVSCANNSTTTTFSVANYSGFVARNVAIDLRYGDNKGKAAWIAEWLKAHNDKQGREPQHKTIGEGVFYQSSPTVWIPQLEPGETISKNLRGEPLFIRGSFALQTVCPQPVLPPPENDPPSKSHPVHIRVTWQNEFGHTFDEVHQYALVCTLDRDADANGRVGYAFTFVPEGIISRKDSILTQHNQ